MLKRYYLLDINCRRNQFDASHRRTIPISTDLFRPEIYASGETMSKKAFPAKKSEWKPLLIGRRYPISFFRHAERLIFCYERTASFLLLAVILFGLSACAGFDLSVLDTAKTMGKGRISTGYTYGMAMDIPGWMDIDPQDIWSADSVQPLHGIEVAYGLEDDIDATVRASAHSDGAAGKLLIKKQLHLDEKNSTAIVFGGGIISAGNRYFHDNPDFVDRPDYLIVTGEAQLLYTIDMSEKTAITLAGRGNAHRVKIMQREQDDIFEEIYHAGARMIVSRTINRFTAMLELGIEAPLSAGDIDSVYPWGAMKLSWQWKDRKRN